MVVVVRAIERFFEWLHEAWLERPLKVCAWCAMSFVALVLVDGTALGLWSLRQERADLEQNIVDLRQKIQLAQVQLKRSQDPAEIEKMARSQLDLVKEGDLVFVFSE